MIRTLMLTGAAFALTTGMAGAATIVTTLDDFDTNPAQLTEDLPTQGAVSASQASGGAGGFRDVQAINTSGLDAIDGGTTAQVNAQGQGRFRLSNDSQQSGSALITYDGDDSPTSVNTTGLGGFDATFGGAGVNYRFALDIISADLPFGGSLQLWDNDSSDTVNFGIVSTAQIQGGNIVQVPYQITIDYSSFTGIDFTQIGAVQLGFNGIANGDLTVDNYGILYDEPSAVIPLPATLPLLLAGLGAVGFASRRRKA